jgi:hypothetical protein
MRAIIANYTSPLTPLLKERGNSSMLCIAGFITIGFLLYKKCKYFEECFSPLF